MDATGGSGSNSPVWPIIDDNGFVDTNDTMDNLEDRISNLEKVFAYLKTKKIIERKENKPNKDHLLLMIEPMRTLQNLKLHLNQKVPPPSQKRPCSSSSLACIGNKPVGKRKPKDSIAADQDRKGKKKPVRSMNPSRIGSSSNRKLSHSKIPNIDPPAGIFVNHHRRLFKCDFMSLDPRIESRKSAMDNLFTFGSNEEAANVKILQSYNGLLLYSGSGSPAFDYVYNPCTNLFKPQPENSHYDSHFDVTVVLRMAFNPTKSLDYKVVQLFARINSDFEIQVYSSKTGN
ncbi:hypothetical protein Tco_1475921 [Tanacetum coccineum]